MLLSFASHSTTGPSASAILFATRRASFLHLAASLSSSFSSSAVAATAEKDDGAQQRNDAGKRQQRRPPTIRRRTRGGVSHDAAAVPSLADFMHRAKVLRQYRNFVRLARFVDAKDGGTADNNSAGGCIAALDEVRQSYKVKMKKDMDAIARNMAYSEGERKLREIGTMVGYSAGDRSRESSAHTSPQSYDADSWINIQDEEDRRGRVGVQWPWQRDGEEK